MFHNNNNIFLSAALCTLLFYILLIFVSAMVDANNLFQGLSHHLALTQLGQQNGAQSMLDQCRGLINHRVFFSKYLIKHGGK